MFDIGWSELMVIAVVLIVVVGPKDLPPMIRAFGKMTANLRKMAGEFRNQFDDALKEVEMDDVRRTIADAQKLNPSNALRDAINPLRQIGQDIKSDLQKATAPDRPSEAVAMLDDHAPATPLEPVANVPPPVTASIGMPPVVSAQAVSSTQHVVPSAPAPFSAEPAVQMPTVDHVAVVAPEPANATDAQKPAKPAKTRKNAAKTVDPAFAASASSDVKKTTRKPGAKKAAAKKDEA